MSVVERTIETRTLLVVEASFDLGNALADAAIERGWEPFLAGNGEAALGILHRLSGEVLVLVDLSSAVSRGLALVLSLRRSPPPPGVRLVVMTSGQPIPEAVRRSPFVAGAVRRPRHPAEAEALADVLLGGPDIARIV
jgi:ActR/RegA family two-component response regulator